MYGRAHDSIGCKSLIDQAAMLSLAGGGGGAKGIQFGKFLSNILGRICGSSFKGFSIAVLVVWLAKVESSQKSNRTWFFGHFFAPYL